MPPGWAKRGVYSILHAKDGVFALHRGLSIKKPFGSAWLKTVRDTTRLVVVNNFSELGAVVVEDGGCARIALTLLFGEALSVGTFEAFWMSRGAQSDAEEALASVV